MTICRKIGLLSFDCLDIGIGLPVLYEMGVRQLDYWAEKKRAKDARTRETNKQVENQIRKAGGKHGL